MISSLIKNYFITINKQKITCFRASWSFTMSILTPPIQNYWRNLGFLYFYQHAKNQFTPSIHTWDTTNCGITTSRVATPIFDNAFTNIFELTYNVHEFVPTCKKWSSFIIFLFGNTVDLKILQSDWPKAFWSISKEPDFSKDLGLVQEYNK